MLNTEKRIAALEASAIDDTIRVIVIEDGEAKAEVFKPVGLGSGALRVIYLTPLDA